MYSKVLVANREAGALRVICFCVDMGIRTVEGYSEAGHVSFLWT